MPASAGRGAVRQGEARPRVPSDEPNVPRSDAKGAGSALLRQMLTKENMQRAWKRVKANKGAAGVDGLDIDQSAEHLKQAWPGIREGLLSGTYRPGPVRRVGIPKPDGSERELGIPTVTDRLIQQALLQVLQPLLDPTFSEHSHGFRPGRRAHDAILEAQRYVQAGLLVVVDVALAKFFDRVNKDILIDRLRRRIADAGVIRLVPLLVLQSLGPQPRPDHRLLRSPQHASPYLTSTSRTARCGPARRVVWQESGPHGPPLCRLFRVRSH